MSYICVNCMWAQDPNWYKARRSDGLEGMIPYNYVVEKTDDHSILSMPPVRPDAKVPEVISGGSGNKGAVKLHTMP